jgi:hypothetical protein
MRTTLNIDEPVLADLRRIQREEKKSLGEIVSDLLSEAISRRRAAPARAPIALAWSSQSMGARVDLGDKDAVYQALESDDS